jgi:hypothetical protein
VGGGGEREEKLDRPTGLVEELNMTVVVKWLTVGRCRRRRGDGIKSVEVAAQKVASFPLLQRSPAERLGYCRWGFEARRTLACMRRGPHLLYIALRDGSPPTTSRLGAPDQGAIKDSDSVVGPSRTRSILTERV